MGLNIKIQTYHNDHSVLLRITDHYVIVYTLPHARDGTVYPAICAKGIRLTSCPADKKWDELLAPVMKVSTSPW